MNRSFFIPMLLLPLIFGCANNNVVNQNYTQLFKADVETLVNGPWISKVETVNYNIAFSHTLTSDELGHVYTVDIGYKDTYIDDIQVIVIPGSFMNNPLEHNLPHVGYSQRINLAESKNIENNDRENIRLQIELVDSEENFFVSVKYEETINLFKF